MSLFHHQRRSVLLAFAVVTTKLLWIVVTTASWKFLVLGEIFNPPDADASVQPTVLALQGAWKVLQDASNNRHS